MRCARETLALALLAACSVSPNGSSSEPETSDTSSTGANSTGEPTTTGELDCGALTRCGQTCVDLASNEDNCGDCGIACRIDHATAACIDSACTFAACDLGRADCDGSLINGCELELGETEDCPLVCAPDHPELCNLFDDDCDDACDELAADCRHPVHRARSDTLGRLYTIDPREAADGDYTVESLNYFHLYTAGQPGLVPFHRCLLAGSQHYYTTSATCDDIATLEGVLGHIAVTPVCGAVPLYRLSNGIHTNYLYTHDPAERDDAIANQGYLYETIAGHVWPDP